MKEPAGLIGRSLLRGENLRQQNIEHPSGENSVLRAHVKGLLGLKNRTYNSFLAMRTILVRSQSNSANAVDADTGFMMVMGENNIKYLLDTTLMLSAWCYIILTTSHDVGQIVIPAYRCGGWGCRLIHWRSHSPEQAEPEFKPREAEADSL